MNHKIMLHPNEVNDFVAAACKSSCDIDVFYNSYIVDAKSILGVLGLDLGKVLTVRVHGFDPEFESFITRYALAC